eukprot:2710374-Prymnesium_polylepis.1
MLQGGRWRARAGERDSSALTMIGQLSAAQAGAVCCTICSFCTRVAAACPRASPFQNLQSSSTDSIFETAFAVARRSASTVRLRSLIRTDGSSDVLRRDIPWI